MDIRVGELELKFSGIVIQMDDQPIGITLPDKIEGDYTFIIKFRNDVNLKETLTKFNPLDSHTLEMDFVNFDEYQDAGNSKIAKIGTLEKRELLFNYRIHSLKNVGKTLIYNFYLGKEVK